ncbi:hypothetical protein EBZ39_05290 [bacterium]|nr:hypothetical protein [bacterium]
MDEQLTQEQLQDLWNEEAQKLDAGEQPADELQGAAPDEPPQDDRVPTEPAADPLASLPEEFRAKLARIDSLEQANAQLLHHVKSADGRMAAIQREFQQARQAAAQMPPQEAPSQGQMVAAAKNPEKWEQLKQDFPEWAGAMEEYVTAKLGGVQPQASGLTPQQVQELVFQQVAQTKAEMGLLLEEARVEGKHEDWKQTVNTPEFASWFFAQSADTRALADSPRARDAIRMLDLYEQAKARPAADIRQERNQRLAAAATTRPGQTPPPKTLDDMSPQELWNYEAARREKERAQRGY